MQIQNNKEEVPFAHYCARYRCFIPEEAAARCGVRFDAEKSEFEITLLGVKYRLSLAALSLVLDAAVSMVMFRRYIQTSEKAVSILERE